jgi:hypothetical protein
MVDTPFQALKKSITLIIPLTLITMVAGLMFMSYDIAETATNETQDGFKNVSETASKQLRIQMNKWCMDEKVTNIFTQTEIDDLDASTFNIVPKNEMTTENHLSQLSQMSNPYIYQNGEFKYDG